VTSNQHIINQKTNSEYAYESLMFLQYLRNDYFYSEELYFAW